jgi:hypothetical protein
MAELSFQTPELPPFSDARTPFSNARTPFSNGRIPFSNA